MQRFLIAISMIFLATGALAEGPQENSALDLLQARALVDANHPDQAVAKLDAAIAADPDAPYLRLERAKLLYRLGKLDLAAADVAQARQALADDEEVLRTQGRVELARSDDDPAAAATARDDFEALRRKDPDDLEALVSLGQIELAAGHAELAAEDLDRAAELRPGHPWIESLRARAHATMGDSGLTEKLLQQFLDRHPEDLSTRFELAERLGSTDQHDAAVKLLESATADQLRSPELRQRLARQLFLAGDLDRAHDLAGPLLDERPEDPAVRQLLGRIALAQGEFTEAETVLQPLVGPDEGDAQSLQMLLAAYEAQGKIDDAAGLLQRRASGERQSENASAAAALELERARLNARAGRWEQARALAAVLAGSDQAQIAGAALGLEARSLAKLGRLDDALTLLGPETPDAPERGLQRLDLLLDAGRVAAASRTAEALLADGGDLVLGVGSIYEDRGDFARALPLLERAQRETPDSAEALFRLATCQERLGHVDEAVKLFGDILDRSPRFTPALNYLGYLWIERSQNLARAVGMVREAVRLDPGNGAYVDSLGWGLYKSGEIQNAIGYLERAARLLPHDPMVLEHLGDARAAQGDRDGARAAYERALSTGEASNAELQRKLASLGGGI